MAKIKRASADNSGQRESIWMTDGDVQYRGFLQMGRKADSTVAGLKREKAADKSSRGGFWNRRCAAAALITICLLTVTLAQVQPHHVHRILVLNSYHPSFQWTKLEMEGIESTLKQYKDKIELDIEYLDTKHCDDETHYENLYTLYKHKARSRTYDLIIVTDNDAIFFLLQYRDELYPDVPVVFCGAERHYNNILKDYDAIHKNYRSVTGVMEIQDYVSTLEVALKFHPSATRVVFLTILPITESSYWDGLREAVTKCSRPLELVNYSATEFTMEAVFEKLEKLGDESIVFLAHRFRDPEGNLYPYEKDVVMVRQRCGAPIYAFAETRLGFGPVGGKLVRGFSQGTMAAEIAIRILDGEDASDIPLVKESSSQYMFDYVQLKHFGIPLTKLPEASIVINKPHSFYYLYKRQIWAVTAIIVCLTATIVILSANILRRKHAEAKLLGYQGQLKSLASELSLAEERERRQLATAVHDRISQALVISKINLDALREAVSSDNVKALNKISKSLGQTIEDMRSLTFEISPPVLYEFGLGAAVEWFLEEIHKKHGLAYKFEDNHEPELLDDDVRVLLYQSIRELLFNVIKHARAKKVKVSIRKDDDQMRITVADDGVGFDPVENILQPGRKNCFGLFSIRERLRSLGGKFKIESGFNNRGTRVILALPLAHNEGTVEKE